MASLSESQAFAGGAAPAHRPPPNRPRRWPTPLCGQRRVRSCVRQEPGRASSEVFAVGPGRAATCDYFPTAPGAGWIYWYSLGGHLAGRPRIADSTTAALEAFALGKTDASLGGTPSRTPPQRIRGRLPRWRREFTVIPVAADIEWSTRGLRVGGGGPPSTTAGRQANGAGELGRRSPGRALRVRQ